MGRKVWIALGALGLVALACTCGPLSALTQAGEAIQSGQETIEELEGLANDLEGLGEELDNLDLGEPGTAQAPAGADEQGMGGLLGGGMGLENLDSYTARLVVTFEGTDQDDQPINSQLTINIAYQKEPFATRFEIQGGGPGVETFGLSNVGEGSSLVMTVVENRSYLETVDENGERTCLGFPLTETDLQSGTFSLSPEDVVDIPSLPEMTEVGEETVNGIPSKHYRAEGVSNGELNNATVDVWIASDGDYLTRMQITDEGYFEGFGTGAMMMSYEILSANQGVTITPPADCEVLDFEVPEGDQ